MRIAIIAHGLTVAGGLAVGKKILQGLCEIGQEHHYLFVFPKNLGYEQLSTPQHAERIYFSGNLIARWRLERDLLNNKLEQWQPDVIWCLGNIGFAKPNAVQAVLLHNAHFVYPEIKTYRAPIDRIKMLFRARAIKKGIAASDLLVCQTQTMLNRACKQFDYKGTTALLANAVDSQLKSQHPPSENPKFCLLCLTRYYAHKNLETLVATYEQHGEALQGTQIWLTIDPAQHPHAKALLTRVKKLDGAIINLGPISREALAETYQNANAMILPTLLESFSGTYIEAMQFGKPIATSDRDFAHEVCDDAADYFDPKDTNSIRDVILKLSSDPHHCANLQQKGFQQLTTFANNQDQQLSMILETLRQLAHNTDA